MATEIDTNALAAAFFGLGDEANAAALAALCGTSGLLTLGNRSTVLEAPYATSYVKTGTGGVPITGAVSLDLATKRVFHVVKGDNGQTWTFLNPVAGIRFSLIIEQDNTGSRTKPTLAGYTFLASGGAGALPTLTTTANRADIFEFVAVSATVAIQIGQVLALG